jgi:hypothetical protein
MKWSRPGMLRRRSVLRSAFAQRSPGACPLRRTSASTGRLSSIGIAFAVSHRSAQVLNCKAAMIAKKKPSAKIMTLPDGRSSAGLAAELSLAVLASRTALDGLRAAVFARQVRRTE